MEIQNIPQSISAFIEFTIDFAQHPQKELKKHCERNKLSGELVTFVGIAAGFSWLNILLAGVVKFQVSDEEQDVLNVLNKVSSGLVPVMVMLMILLITGILFHVVGKGLIKLYSLISKKGSPDSFLSSTLKDTINATLGFFAFFITILSLLFATLLLTMQLLSWYLPAAEINKLAYIAHVMKMGFAVVAVLLLLGYFPNAISSVYEKTSFRRALITLCFVIGAVAGFVAIF